MRISFSDKIDGVKTIPLGKITAASNWHGAYAASDDDFYKAKALHKLMRAAEEYEADAIVGVDYEVDQVDGGDTPGSAPMKRVCASGVAVKIRRS